MAKIEIQLHPDRESREKALRSMANLGYLNVWEGAVRSGKTVFALCAFAIYAVRSKETSFLLSGRTVKTIEKNCITEDFGLLNLIPGSTYGKVGESKAVTFYVRQDGQLVKKSIFVAGAADIRAYMAIRGNSYGGWFADEINMHDREFVNEALRRTIASHDRKHFWTLNPDNPRHWVYTEYLDRYDAMTKAEKRKLGGYHWWHFVPYDNPAMTTEMLDSLELMYPKGSYLYDRYILGNRCMAEGLIYPRATKENVQADIDPSDVDLRYASIDYGTDHPTVIYLGGPIKGDKTKWAVVAEYFDEKSDKTTFDHWEKFVLMCDSYGVDPHRVRIAIDPAAGAIKKEFIKQGALVQNAKNDVLEGIEFTRRVLYDGTLKLSRMCVHIFDEFATYAWDETASQRGEDKPVKIHDDCCDSLRYFGMTHIRPMIRG